MSTVKERSRALNVSIELAQSPVAFAVSVTRNSAGSRQSARVSKENGGTIATHVQV
jgi:hypothetical protein